MALADRLRSPGFQWTAIAALAVVALSVVPAVWPGLFVGPSGQISVLSGGATALLAVGLLLGWRWVRYVALAFLSVGGALALLWAVTNASPPFVVGHIALAVLSLFAAGVLAFVRPVQSYFDQSGTVSPASAG